jgi:hypothetical protein
MLIAPVLHGDVYMLARRTTGILWEMMAVYQILGFLANPGIRETMAWWYAISCRQIDFVSDFFYAEELQLLNAEPWNWQQQIAQRDEMVSIGHFAFLYVMGEEGGSLMVQIDCPQPNMGWNCKQNQTFPAILCIPPRH